MRFDLFTLQLLLTVCEEKSIARAADRENIAASAVSKRISDLETRLRMSLFHRTSKGLEPTAATHEGFRLLALHRQGARGEPSFNACRETCRELVYLRNVALAYDGDTPELRRTLRLQAMVLRHLALFVGGKMVEAGLGDFCCSSRPLRHRDAPPLQGD